MTTHYDAEFNAAIPSTDLSGIEEIFADGAAMVDVYNTQGVLIKKNCTKQELNQLPSGIYIIRGATEAIKILIK